MILFLLVLLWVRARLVEKAVQQLLPLQLLLEVQQQLYRLILVRLQEWVQAQAQAQEEGLLLLKDRLVDHTLNQM